MNLTTTFKFYTEVKKLKLLLIEFEMINFFIAVRVEIRLILLCHINAIVCHD